MSKLKLTALEPGSCIIQSSRLDQHTEKKKRATGAEKLKSRLRLNKPDYSIARGRNTAHESR